ncbi:hypothetical protein EAX61_06055 [Dokdonia sinensis]|uniref:Uncharacterized protein n=1 Tax=Dokdonia sinensis TaxID=2479847 RepID=A0A3M0G9E3_9FLAO|nr:hypothetical protein [Dokdonia sinensis]RMB61038.1 hypothetical protein EAX61_06055 [Dokdonia sinensis]
MNKEQKEDFYRRLSALFSKYESILTSPEQLEILKKGFAFSDIDYNADVLIMGMNPSLRTNFLSEDGYSYDYPLQSQDMYFKKFYKLLEPYSEHKISYTDLFYQKHSEQVKLKYFLKDKNGREFLQEQLELTKAQIIKTQPKLILLFNKQGADFFRTPWLPVQIESVENTPIPELKSINFYASDGSSICKLLAYFSTYLGYRTSKKALEKVHREIPEIFKYLSNYIQN